MDAAEERVNVLFLSSVSGKWRKIITPIAAIAVITAILFFPRGQADSTDHVMSGQIPFPDENESPAKLEMPEEQVIQEVSPLPLMVDVKGAVRHPGVYTLQEGDRLIDAITSAGGYLPEADSRLLNHAMKLTDEFVVYVPVEGEEMMEQLPVTGPTTSTNEPSDGKVDLNTADEQQLMTIPGIGPAKASAIIQHRTDNGFFKSTEALMEVSGIGKKTFENLEKYIKVN